MKTIFFAFVVLVAAISNGECQQCPNVATVADFDVTRFGGIWYSLYETSDPRLPCLHYNTTSDAQGDIKITFLPYQVPLTGIRKDPNNVSAGFTMSINFPALNGADFNVVATDYDNWTLLLNCKEANATANTALFYSATLLGRTRTMDPATLANIKGIMDENNINYDTIETMIQPSLPCSIADNLVGPALEFFISHM